MMKLVPATTLALMLALGGTAAAGMQERSSTPAPSTETSAAAQQSGFERGYVYKDGAQDGPHARPNPQSVQPGSDIRGNHLYKNSQQEAHARPRPQSVMPGAALSKDVYGLE